MQMNGLNGLITIAKYRQEWSSQQLIICVLNNRDLNQVTWEQRVMAGDPKLDASQQLPDVSYAGWARSLGLGGIVVDDPDGVAGAWKEALASDVPVVLEAITDPEVPPLPPHIRIEQAKEFMASMVRGDPKRSSVLKQSVKHMADKLKPGR
jgi:pyruvate dehydrogenase (quinone)